MLTPTTENELAEAIATAQDPLSVQGGATRGMLVEGNALSTTGLSGVTLYEPGALTIVAQAGTPLSEIEATLAAENQMLAFEPMDYRSLLGTEGTPTIGGVVASNSSGPRRVQAGACRDFLLGVRFVDGTGNIVKNGGRVMKNVTGYDLARLMCGARGTLGVLTEVSLKVLPKPEYTVTLVLEGTGHAASAKFLTDAMKSQYDVTGAARLSAGIVGEYGAVVLRLEGFEASVKYRAKALAEELGGARFETDPEENSRIWRAVRDVEPFANREGDVWSLSIKPTDFMQLSDVNAEDDKLVDWACGRVWMLMPKGTDLRSKMNGMDGHATLVRGGDGSQPRMHPEAASLAAMARALRQKYDPKGILNPGLMG
ncbi:MAG: glycolate oxidase subunit GlcE [Paracoccaceae bacterium]